MLGKKKKSEEWGKKWFLFYVFVLPHYSIIPVLYHSGIVGAASF